MKSMLIVAAFGVCALVLTGPARAEDTVRIDSGLVSGIVSDTVRTFKGIPFATPPSAICGGVRPS
jgi:hypothetical protein